ncbi:MAG TPA: hypothetical protein VNA68_01345 [Candidatus Dormibacteraeota bacterium]|nr:hypothetical protein [Candidatus Dormibacteraeota bacterium]
MNDQKRIGWRGLGNIAELKEHPLFRDRISQIAIGLAIVFSIATVLAAITQIKQTDYPVPVHYSSLVGFDKVGKWYENYQIVFFSLVATFVNTLLAAKSFRRNRVASFFLLSGSVVVSLFCLIISVAFASIT